MEQNIIDLDVLRPPPRIVRLASKEIDVSFIPCAITFEVDRLANEIRQMSAKEIDKGGKALEKAFEATVGLCSTFCAWKHKEMTREWFLQNTDPVQINRLASEIMDTLARSYAGVEQYVKNQDAAGASP